MTRQLTPAELELKKDLELLVSNRIPPQIVCNIYRGVCSHYRRRMLRSRCETCGKLVFVTHCPEHLGIYCESCCLACDSVDKVAAWRERSNLRAKEEPIRQGLSPKVAGKSRNAHPCLKFALALSSPVNFLALKGGETAALVSWARAVVSKSNKSAWSSKCPAHLKGHSRSSMTIFGVAI